MLSLGKGFFLDTNPINPTEPAPRVLFPYQQIGANWLASKSQALLADEMGLGKTGQAISAADQIKAKRILVVCPAVARYNWLNEFRMWSKTPRNYQVVIKSSDPVISADLIIVSYDFAASHYHSLRCIPAFDLLIIDECHFLKSTAANRTKAIYGIHGLIHHAKRTWALSGTPAPNHAAELWPMLYTFGQTKLTYDEFIRKFCSYYPYRHQLQVTGTKLTAIPELKTLLEPIMLRRKKDEVMKELPPIYYDHLVVEPGEVDLMMEASFMQYAFPQDRRQELKDTLTKQKNLVTAVVEQVKLGREGMAALAGIANSVSTLRRYNGIQKVAPVAEIVIEELMAKAYKKLVIFAIHRDVIEGLRVRLKAFHPLTLYGGTDPETKERNLMKFQTIPKFQVFIGNIHACGTAVSLTAAHNVLFVEQDWVPGNNAQAAMRCHRIGQTKPVVVRTVGLNDSIDLQIMNTLNRKTRELTELFERPVLRKADLACRDNQIKELQKGNVITPKTHWDKDE